MKKGILILLFTLLTQITFSQDKLLDILKIEVARNHSTLKAQPSPAYYISYRVQDAQHHNINSSFGNILYSTPQHNRLFHVSVRVGNHEMDNTRPIGNLQNSYVYNPLVLEDDAVAIQNALWKRTDELYKNAVKQLENVKASVAVKVTAEDKSNDFSKEKPEKYFEKPMQLKDLKFDIEIWEKKVKKYGEVFAENKDILTCNVIANVELIRKYFVDTEGAEIAENSYAYRISLIASTTADDGMSLPLYKSYFALDIKDLPSDAQVIEDARQMSKMITELKKAPVAESYSGPALMTAEAAGVFFHEIFGHRIEGARLKLESDAQTFKKKIGELVLPEDFSIIFDPKLKKYKDIPLNGSYVFDDEGVRGQKVVIVENGILKSFLMSRTPIDKFPNSNGHGRAMIYFNNVTRQSNMIIESNKSKTEAELRTLLTEQLKKDNKEYGYIKNEFLKHLYR